MKVREICITFDLWRKLQNVDVLRLVTAEEVDLDLICGSMESLPGSPTKEPSTPGNPMVAPLSRIVHSEKVPKSSKCTINRLPLFGWPVAIKLFFHCISGLPLPTSSHPVWGEAEEHCLPPSPSMGRSRTGSSRSVSLSLQSGSTLKSRLIHSHQESASSLSSEQQHDSTWKAEVYNSLVARIESGREGSFDEGSGGLDGARNTTARALSSLCNHKSARNVSEALAQRRRENGLCIHCGNTLDSSDVATCQSGWIANGVCCECWALEDICDCGDLNVTYTSSCEGGSSTVSKDEANISDGKKSRLGKETDPPEKHPDGIRPRVPEPKTGQLSSVNRPEIRVSMKPQINVQTVHAVKMTSPYPSFATPTRIEQPVMEVPEPESAKNPPLSPTSLANTTFRGGCESLPPYHIDTLPTSQAHGPAAWAAQLTRQGPASAHEFPIHSPVSTGHRQLTPSNQLGSTNLRSEASLASKHPYSIDQPSLAQQNTSCCKSTPCLFGGSIPVMPPAPPRKRQIEQFHQQLYSDVDYVIYPHKDPELSRQEYMDAKSASTIALEAQGYSSECARHNSVSPTYATISSPPGSVIYEPSASSVCSSRYSWGSNYSAKYPPIMGSHCSLVSSAPSRASYCPVASDSGYGPSSGHSLSSYGIPGSDTYEHIRGGKACSDTYEVVYHQARMQAPIHHGIHQKATRAVSSDNLHSAPPPLPERRKVGILSWQLGNIISPGSLSKWQYEYIRYFSFQGGLGLSEEEMSRLQRHSQSGDLPLISALLNSLTPRQGGSSQKSSTKTGDEPPKMRTSSIQESPLPPIPAKSTSTLPPPPPYHLLPPNKPLPPLPNASATPPSAPPRPQHYYASSQGGSANKRTPLLFPFKKNLYNIGPPGKKNSPGFQTQRAVIAQSGSASNVPQARTSVPAAQCSRETQNASYCVSSSKQ